MNEILQFILIFVSICFIIFIFWNIKKKKMQYRSLLLWLLLSITTLIIAIFPQIITVISNVIYIKTPSNTIFLIYISLLLLIIFHLTINYSCINRKITVLVQENALLNKRIKDLEEINKNK